MRPTFALLLLALLMVTTAAWPAGGYADSAGAGDENPDFRAGVAAWKQKDWPTVITRMQVAVDHDPNNADAWNYMGHAARQHGDLAAAFHYHERALQIDPVHRSAHAYSGEAHLVAGNLAKAEEHLQALDRICTFPCQEFRDLQVKIQRYRQDHAPSAPN